jgi:hypothetical protein
MVVGVVYFLGQFFGNIMVSAVKMVHLSRHIMEFLFIGHNSYEGMMPIRGARIGADELFCDGSIREKQTMGFEK